MSFPTSPTEGQIHNNYQYTDNLWKKVGDIVESGSNDYGSYTKYSDGTAICNFESDNIQITRTTSPTEVIIVPPIAFIEFNASPRINFIHDSNIGYRLGRVLSHNITNSNYYFMVDAIGSGYSYFKYSYTAIGRWK